jgi:hypothetical protein
MANVQRSSPVGRQDSGFRWYQLNSRAKTVRPLRLARGGPPVAPHIVVVGVTTSSDRLRIILLNSTAPVLATTRSPSEKYDEIVDVVLLDRAAYRHLFAGSVPDVGVVRYSDPLGSRSADIPFQQTADPESPNTIGIRPDGPAPEEEWTSATLNIQIGIRSIVVQYWAPERSVEPSGTGLLSDIATYLDQLWSELPSWPRPALVTPLRPGWFVFHRTKQTTSPLPLPHRDPYRNQVLVLGMLQPQEPRVVAIETTDPRFDSHEIPTEKGTAVRGADAERIVTALVSASDAAALLAGMADSTIVVTTVDPEGLTGADPVVLPITVHGNDMLWVPGQYAPVALAGASVLVAVAAPGVAPVILQYVTPMGSRTLLHDALSCAIRIGVALGLTPAINFAFGPADVPTSTAPRCDSHVAQRRTMVRATALLSAPANDDVERDRTAVDEFVQSMLRDPDEHSRVRRLLRLYDVTAEEIAAVRLGSAVLALIVVECCLEVQSIEENAIVGPLEREEIDNLRAVLFADAEPAEVFADALTAYLRAQVTEHARSRARSFSRVNNFTHEWLARTQSRPHQTRIKLDARKIDGDGIVLLDELLLHAPWLAMLVHHQAGPRRKSIVVDECTLIEILALVRPRTVFIPGASSARSNPGNWRSISRPVDLGDLTCRYVLPSGAASRFADEPRLLDDLARGCEILYHLPWQARRTVQALTDLGPLADALDKRASEALVTRGAELDDIAIVVDRPIDRPPRIMLVNADSQRRCSVIVGETTVQLAEYAAGIPDAASYFSSPLTLPDDQETVEIALGEATRRVPLMRRSGVDESSSSDSERVDTKLFRGRHEQLTEIFGVMDPRSNHRSPICIFGPRRAGKTTLAIHACRRACERGWLSDFARIDLFNEPSGLGTDKYLPSLTRLLTERVAPALGVTLTESPDDPAEALDAIDRALGDRTAAVVLDEFDSLLSHPGGSPLQELAVRLGVKRWRNLVVIATVQRFYHNASELETWQFVNCPADLRWRDGIGYFAGHLDEIEDGSRSVPELRSPVVLPLTFRNVVHRRLGLRPYFWGRLRAKLEAIMRVGGGYAVADIDSLDEIVDGFIEADPFLALPLQPTDGISLSEIRRRDLFSHPEKRILAQFASSDRKRIDLEDAIAVGGQSAVRELVERAFVVTVDNQLNLAVPLFGEHLRANPLDFEHYMDAAPATELPRPSVPSRLPARAV